MTILNRQPTAITYHYVRWIELTNLVDQKVTHNKLYKVTLILLNILLFCLLKQLWKMLLQTFIPDWKNVHVLIKVIATSILRLLIHLLREIVIILWIIIQLL